MSEPREWSDEDRKTVENICAQKSYIQISYRLRELFDRLLAAYDAVVRERDLEKAANDNAMKQFFQLQQTASDTTIKLEQQLAAEKERADTAIKQTTKIREACANYPIMVQEALNQRDALAKKLKAAEAEIEELKLLNHPVMADLQLQERFEKERDAFGEKLKAAEANVAHWKAARQSAVEAGDRMKAELTRERECNKVLREALEKALEKEKEVRDGKGGSTCNKNS